MNFEFYLPGQPKGLERSSVNKQTNSDCLEARTRLTDHATNLIMRCVMDHTPIHVRRLGVSGRAGDRRCGGGAKESMLRPGPGRLSELVATLEVGETTLPRSRGWGGAGGGERRPPRQPRPAARSAPSRSRAALHALPARIPASPCAPRPRHAHDPNLKPAIILHPTAYPPGPRLCCPRRRHLHFLHLRLHRPQP